MRSVVPAAFAIVATAWQGYPCSCGPPQPACAYLDADVIFLGRATFSNDDRRGGLRQWTLVRFDLEERFKGISAETKQVWIDPGSFTSCYTRYEVGKRYLIFATGNPKIPADTPAVTVLRGAATITKPDPPGFDRTNPPPVYSSPGCSGSREDTTPWLEADLEMLRTYRSGGKLPRVIGHVFLSPYLGWPILSGTPITEARVKVEGGGITLNAVADRQGKFTLADAPVGTYSVQADASPYRMTGTELLHVPRVGCGYVDVQMRTNSSVSGTVVDNAGRPVPKVTVRLTGKAPDWERNVKYFALKARTNERGAFTIEGVPDEDLVLAAGETFPTTADPFSLTNHPTTIRLKPGQQQRNIVLRLKPLETVSVTIRIKKRNGSPAAGAKLWAFDDRDVVAEQSVADANGVAKLNCLSGLKYNLKSFDYFPTKHPMSKAPFRCEAGKVVTYFDDELEAVRGSR